MTQNQHTPSDAERDLIEVDVVCVGAGVASLSAVLRLLKKLRAEKPDCDPPHIMILEKGIRVGAHALSGAVMNPAPLKALLDEKEQQALPAASHVRSEQFYYMCRNRALRLPVTPPPMRAHGFPIVSISELSAWLAERCEAAGAEIYTELTAAEWLMQDGRIIGVRVGDKGIDKHGNRKANYEAGPDIHARVVLLGEGACGALTEQLVTEKHLNRTANKQTYALGIKELIRLPADPQRAGRIFHTFGYPMDYRTYGGGFFYGMDESHVALGLVTALDYRHPDLNPHDCFRAFKAHPLVRKHIQDGTVEEYGAKVIPEGGYFSIPELVTDGAMILGDSAGLQDSVWLKGIHLAIESGVAAGNTLFECMQQEDWSLSQLQHYPEQLKTMNGWRRMKKYRNVRGAFQYGLLPGIAATGISWLTGGWLPPGRIRQHEDHQTLRPRSGRAACTKQAPPLDTDRQLQLDILSDVYYSGTEHEEDQPGHLVIPDPEHCIRQCMDPFGAPCTRFCPAQVYEMADDGRQIIIQPSNCLHCRTCQIKCPFQNIIWRLPEGGGGPRYKRM